MAVDPFAGATGDELIVATPELVTFGYQLAGPGSRFLAQMIDFPLQVLLLVVALVSGLAIGGVVGDVNVALVVAAILGFIVVWGYFPVSEAVWSGKTLGKYAFGLRVVGDQGEPIQLSQAVIRNLVRIVDFLPFFYGIGIIALFWNGRGKRLGDLAAGTVVVRERAPVRLSQLLATSPDAAPAVRLAPADAALLRGLEPELRQFVTAYALRRFQLDSWRRSVLASRAEPALRRALGDTVVREGPLAALDRLADLAAREEPV
ncbi:MAG TPA: RDD family protein [Candidatus Dormibacteraeota bacterium]|nr:RDD family protein [Candidatus Dormibacteraeota bacterium]